MLKNTFCSICLSINKMTINIYETDLQYVYENLANLKIRDNECWMCYICHTRLRQCHQLKQLVVQTRGLIYDMFQNKINIKLGAFGSLLELSTSRTKITSTTLPHIKQESDGEMEFYYENSVLHDEIVENRNTKIISTTPHSSYIKLESDVKTEYCSDDDGVQDEIFENTNDYEEACDSITQRLSNVDENVALQTTHAEDVDDEGEEKYSTGNSKIKQEIEVEIEDRGIPQDNSNDCEGRDRASEAQSGCYKKQFTCDYCFKIFSYKSKLLNHIRVHTGEKPFSCDFCLKNFSHKCHLIIHIRTHTDERPFSCDICPKKFSQKRYLDEHVAGHTGNKSFSCNICSKTFTRKNNLNTHMRTHTQNTPFVCDICSKKFTQSNHLDTHMRIHTGVKPYSCHICSKKFARTSSLNIHKLIHTHDKPFSCDICSKRFLRKGHLTDHLLTHRGEQPHSCHICLKKFSRKSTLKRHTKNHYGEEA